jgi:hypothetical protein
MRWKEVLWSFLRWIHEMDTANVELLEMETRGILEFLELETRDCHRYCGAS